MDLNRIKPKAFMKNLPEHWLTDIFEFQFCFLRFKEDYIKNLVTKFKGNSNLVDCPT